MQQQKKIPALAPYGSMAFLPVTAKVGGKNPTGGSGGMSVTVQRKLVRRNASV
jgi:hypothetical protein